MARATGLGILLGVEAVLLVASAATVLPAVRDGIEGAETRIVERIAAVEASLAPILGAASETIADVLSVASAPSAVPSSSSSAAAPPALAAAPTAPAREPTAIAESPAAPAQEPPALAALPAEPPQEPLPALAETPPVAETPTPATTARAAPEPPTVTGSIDRSPGRPGSMQPPPPPSARRTLAAALEKPAPGEISALQQRLAGLGLMRGPTDGSAGDETVTALTRYLDRRRLSATMSFESILAHMDRSLALARAPGVPTEVFLVSRAFAPELRAELTRVDLEAAQNTIVRALTSLERGQSISAYARRGGASFVVTPVAGEPFERCRRFTMTIHLAGREQTGRGIRACRIGPSWHLSDG